MIFTEPPADFAPQFTTVACFVEAEGQFLALQRQTNKDEGGKWGMPAGKLEANETELEAVKRELFEETLIRAAHDPVKIQTLAVRYPNYDFFFPMYRLSLPKLPRVTIDQREHLAYQWVTPQQLLMLDHVLDFDTIVNAVYSLE